jgi:2-polyprenyl-3-methyl-5-hydroxy-6-metoxy-1,4-benzoquinol methylase
MYDCIIWVCGHGETKDETAKCLCNLGQSQYKIDVRFSHPDALIARSRSVSCTRFLQCDDAPFMIFIDSDQTFTNEDVGKLIRAMQSGYDVIAGGYAMADGTHFAIHAWNPDMTIDGSIQEAQYISTGFMGISRRCLVDMVKKLELPLLHKGQWCEMWALFEAKALPDEGIFISEDWDFCNKARKAGYKTYFHTGVLVGHLKMVNLPPQGALKPIKEVTAPLSTECLVKSLLLSDLMIYLNTTQQDLLERYKEPPEVRMETLYKKWEGNNDDFYKQDLPDYLLELARFNALDEYWQGRLAPIGDIKDSHVVDLGCGIGTTSLFLGTNRNKVVGYDICPTVLDFAESRRQKFGLVNVQFTNELPIDALREADFVIAIDVLEHIKDLGGFLKEIGSYMKTEAKLYHADSFLDKRSMHYDHSEYIHRYLLEAGLFKIDTLWAVRGK